MEQISYIIYLINNLKRAPESRDYNQVQNVIIGALIFRRKAIYEASWFSEYSSALYKTIEEVLGINEANKLDEMTIVTVCRAYHDVLRKMKPEKLSAYIGKEDAAFFSQLERFIADAERNSSVVAKQINHLVTIQSIANRLLFTDDEISKGLAVLASDLGKKLKTDTTVLVQQEIKECLRATKLPELEKLVIEYLLPDSYRLSKANWPKFVDYMMNRVIKYSNLALLGAYLIVLTKTPLEQGVLITTLKEAINTISATNVVDGSTQRDALDALGYYLTLPGMRELDFSGWDSYEALQREVKEQAIDLVRVSEKSLYLAM